MTVQDRREFLLEGGKILVLTGAAAAALPHILEGTPEKAPGYDTSRHWWAMAVDIERCIGCGGCVRACKAENGVPLLPTYFRTWVERYRVRGEHAEHPEVDSPNGGFDGFAELSGSEEGA